MRWYPGATGKPITDAVTATEQGWIKEIDASVRFGPVHTARFPWTANYTRSAYIDLLETYSDHAVLADDHKVPLYEAIAAAIDERGGRIAIPYVAVLLLAHRRPT
jgi:hypothetical protein